MTTTTTADPSAAGAQPPSAQPGQSSQSARRAGPGYQFASDNCAGVCPPAWEALRVANDGFVPSYGDDRWTSRAADLLRELFETDCEVFFCFNGTAANAMSIAHMCRPYHSVICHEVAHLETDECGGPEFFAHGTKLLLASGAGGKVDPAEVRRIVSRRTDIHYPKPKVVSLTQSTEVGTVYTVDELSALSEAARECGLRVHMDGARFANAAAALGVPPKAVTWQAGVDVLCFGGTKNGMPVGDAVVFFDRELAQEFDFRCKQAGQLASKMRYMAAPWVGMLEGGAWLENGRHANRCARRLADLLSAVPGIKLKFPPQANAVFVEMPPEWAVRLRRMGWTFYSFIGAGGGRFMCNWATTDADIDALVADVRTAAGNAATPANGAAAPAKT